MGSSIHRPLASVCRVPPRAPAGLSQARTGAPAGADSSLSGRTHVNHTSRKFSQFAEKTLNRRELSPMQLLALTHFIRTLS